jgi:hypothetical protein
VQLFIFQKKKKYMTRFYKTAVTDKSCGMVLLIIYHNQNSSSQLTGTEPVGARRSTAAGCATTAWGPGLWAALTVALT